MNKLIKLQALCAVLLQVSQAADLATIDPCPQQPGKASAITVTSQYQTVSTCVPLVQNGITSYSYKAYAYVSTTVPCMIDGPAISSTLVTDTAQWITVTKYPEATTTTTDLTNSVVTEVVQKQGLARYDECGDLAFPGWAGSGLCVECTVVAADGSRKQKIRIQECRTRKNVRTCIEYDVYWVFKPEPQATTVVYPACATKSAVSAAGSYVFTFPQPAITKTITLPGKGNIITATQAPWYEYVTRDCGGPTIFDFTTTVTKTLTCTVPYETGQPGPIVTAPNPPPTGFPWPGSGSPGTGAPGGGLPGGGPPGTGGPGTGPPGGDPPGGGPPVISDQPILISTTPASGQFSTVTVTPGGTNTGTVPITITIANPSGTAPGTVIVVEPTQSGNGPTTSAIQPTGPFVTITVTTTGTDAPTLTDTITIADPTDTTPGTVIVIEPTTRTTTPNGATPTTLLTVTTSAGTGAPCMGALCVEISATLPGGDVGVSATVLPTNSNGVGGTGGASATGTPCVGLLCVGVSATLPGAGAGVTATVLPGNGGGTGASAGNPAATPCTGLLCASVGVSVPIIDNTGATVTAGVNNPVVSIPRVINIGGRPTTTPDAANPAPAPTTPCTGLLCVSVGASVSIIDNTGATITAGVNNPVVSIPRVINIGGRPTTTPGAADPAPAATTPCSGPLCVSVGVDASVVDTGLTATAGLGGGSGAAPNTTPAGANPASPTTTPCSGPLCLSAGVNAPIINAGATVTAGVGGGPPAAPNTTPQAANPPPPPATTPQAANPAPAAPTPCRGVLCVSLGASVPVVGGASATAVVLGNSRILGATAGANLLPQTTLARVTTANRFAATAAVSARVSVPIVKKSIPTPLARWSHGHDKRAACSRTLNLCDGIDLDSLFETQACTPLLRIGCISSNTLNTALSSCRIDGCKTYGLTADGGLSLTSDLSVSEIQGRVDAFTRVNGGVCNAGRTVNLYAFGAAC